MCISLCLSLSLFICIYVCIADAHASADRCRAPKDATSLRCVSFASVHKSLWNLHTGFFSNVHVYIHIYTYIYLSLSISPSFNLFPYVYMYIYGVATFSRLLTIIGLFCRISSLLEGSFAKEIYKFKEPTNRSHPIELVSALARCYGVALVSRIDKIIGLFCKRDL